MHSMAALDGGHRSEFHTPTVGATAAALDGNAAANRQTFSGVLLAGAAVYPGQEIFSGGMT